ncbi:MAG: hypothetical protein MJ069_03150 [Salinivirgaceae bacterium]|nr:hypothetical protein [Salinivirgaceae bacterium]
MGNKVFNFWGKTFAVALAAVIAAFSLASCSDDDEEDTKKEEVTKAVEFAPESSAESLLEELRIFANDSTVEKIVCKATGDWSSYNSESVTFFYRNVIPDMDEAAKGKWIGEGDLNYKLGEASKVPDDSIGIVKRGFTINANLKK